MSEVWEETRLFEIARVDRGASWGKDQEVSAGAGAPVIRIANVQPSGIDLTEVRSVVGMKERDLQRALIGPNSLLMVGSNGNPDRVGNVYLSDASIEGMSLASFLIGIHPNDELTSKWLYYFLSSQSLQSRLTESTAGSTGLKNLSLEWVRELLIPLPPLPVQRRIVDLMTHLDNHIENLRTERDTANALLVSARDALLQPGLDWRRTSLTEITTKIGSGATPRGGESAYRNEGTSLIRSQNIYDMRFDWDGLAHIGPEQARLLDGVTVEQGDVLLNITGASVNRCCIVPNMALPARVNQHVAIIRADRGIVIPEFLLHTLRQSEVLALLDRMAGSGTTRQALTKAQIEQLQVLIPELSEQKQLANIFDSLSQHVSFLQFEIDSVAEMRGALLSGVLTGETPVNGEYDAFFAGVA